MSLPRTCPQCGARLHNDALEGLCPDCLGKLALGAESEGQRSEVRGQRSAGLAGEVGRDVPIAPRSPIQHPASSPEHPAKRFGDYELLSEIAHGGMGVVFKARQVSLNRTVAVKMIRAGPFASKEFVHRFRVEASAAAVLQHPNIVAVHEVGVVEGQHFFSMDYVAGQNLAQIVREGPLPPNRAARYVQKIAEAIHYAHQSGILHRDLKPSNVLIDQNDQPRITDFGLAKQLNVESSATLTGDVMGTPGYMPPEQASGNRGAIKAWSDVYSLGAILYHLLTGRAPFAAGSLEETLNQVLHQDPISARLLNPAVPRDLNTICLKCLEKEPAKRYGSAHDLAEELTRFLNHEPILARPISTVGKGWRWCRRKPALAASLGAVMLLLGAVALISTFSAVRQRELRQHAEATVTRLEIDKAEQLFEKDDSATALAILARILRQNPDNRVAAERLLSALSSRNFCLPATAPLGHDTPVTNRVSRGGLYSIIHAFRHRGSITFAQFSPDGERVLTASKDGTARLWDSHSGSLLFEFRHRAEVLCAQFSPDGQRLITASLDKTAQTWDARTGQPDLSPLRHEGGVVFAEFSSKGERIVTASEDRTARIWDARTGESMRAFTHAQNLQFTNDTVYFARFSEDGHLLLTAKMDRSVSLWNVETGERLREFRHNHEGFGIFGYPDLSPNGRRVAAKDGVVWDTTPRSGRPLLDLTKLQKGRRLNSIQFSPDGLSLATGSDNNTAQVWSAETGEPITKPLKHEDLVLHVRFSPDGRRLVTSSRDNSVRVWNARTGEAQTEPLRHDSWVLFAQFSPDGQRILTVPQGTSAWLWDVRTGQPLTELLRHTDPILCARFSPDGQRIATMGRVQGARIWNARTAKLLAELTGQEIPHVAFSPDGQRIVTASHDSAARIWDTETGQALIPPLKHDSGYVDSAQFSPDGQWVVTACRDKTARLWKAATGVEELRFSHQGEVRTARFSPDGQRVLTAAYDNTAGIWDARTGRNLATLRHDDWVFAAEYSPDGRRVITASRDKTARIWDAQTGRLMRTLLHDAELNQLQSAQFSFEGLRVVTASRNAAQVWDSRTGRAITPPLKHPGHVNSARFSPDGQRIVTASQDGAARIWDTETGHPLSEPLWHRDAVMYAEFSPDGQWVVSASLDATARVWEVPLGAGPVPSWLPELAEAVAGQRLHEQDQTEPVSLERLFRLKERLVGSRATEAYAAWAKWFFEDNATRSISASSPLRVPKHVMAQVQENSLDSLREAVSLSPGDALAQARLALAALSSNALQNARLVAEADWQSRRAVTQSPNDADVWWARAQLCERLSRVAEAWEAWERASSLNSTDGAFWNAWGLMLEKTNRVDDALQAYTRAVELSGPWQQRETLPAVAWKNRSNLFKRLGRLDEAVADNLKVLNIARRNSDTPPHLIDLSLYYNRGLDLKRGANFTLMPTGRVTHHDIEFDVRGTIQLSSGMTERDVDAPESVGGIAVRQKCRQLCFLHAGRVLDGSPLDGVTIGGYRMRYVDGRQEEMRIVYGHHVRDDSPAFDPKAPLHSDTKVGWTGTTPDNQAIRLFLTVWENPRPDVAIESLDFITSANHVIPFLFAITAEP